MNPVIATRRLCLRPFTGQDTDAIFAIYSDEQTNRFLPWFPAKTRADAECIFEERYARAGDGDGYALAVCFEDKPIGYVHLDGKPPYDLGYALLPAWQGKGFPCCSACIRSRLKPRPSGAAIGVPPGGGILSADFRETPRESMCV